MKELTEFVERILKLLSVITLLITAVGFIHLVWYYHLYNIPISQYINLSEVFIYSLGNVGIFLIAFLLPIVFIIKAVISRSREVKEVVIKRKFLQNELIFVFICCIAYLILRLFENIIGKTAIIFSTACYFFLIGSYSLIEQLDTDVVKKRKAFKVGLVIALITFGTSALMMLYSILFNNKPDSSKFPSVHLFLNDSTIISTSDTIRYLGKTDGYYFLYNKKSKQSIIYPASRIQQISIIDTLNSKE